MYDVYVMQNIIKPSLRCHWIKYNALNQYITSLIYLVYVGILNTNRYSNVTQNKCSITLPVLRISNVQIISVHILRSFQYLFAGGIGKYVVVKQ